MRCFIECGLDPRCYDAPNTLYVTIVRNMLGRFLNTCMKWNNRIIWMTGQKAIHDWVSNMPVLITISPNYWLMKNKIINFRKIKQTNILTVPLKMNSFNFWKITHKISQNKHSKQFSLLLTWTYRNTKAMGELEVADRIIIGWTSQFFWALL